MDDLLDRIDKATGGVTSTNYLKPLFANEEDYKAFAERHAKATVEERDIESYSGNAYLGIDCGSTTTRWC